ncbi:MULTISPECIES: hypothetical protein [Niastella]|uniref:Uncharacterized protein n=1 Tax=Niastella soli TaxID=2821487 RepID=A0ABS3YVV6_9BACT|nr:hypothetical protein [Niastella soli]MBO9202067.1 hypothetical protein [Niastella soli]
MKFRTWFSSVAVVVFHSCYSPAQVVLHNKSGTDKNIHVLYPASHRPVIATDSLQAYDHTLTEHEISTRDIYRYGLAIPLENIDTVNRSYSFLLKNKHQVIVESSWPVRTLPWGQAFIINGSDTIVLQRKGKPFKRRGGSWIFIIQ